MTLRLPLPDGVDLLDVELFGAPELSCCYLVHAREPALIETGPATVFDTVRQQLDAAGVEPKHIVLSHIHLDHGGGVGHIADRFGDATIWVHDIGARHVADPSRLVASARRLFGDALDTMYGEPRPVAEPRLRAMSEGTVIDLGDRELRVAYTPGHASHEVTIFDPSTAAAFVGDTSGVCYGDAWQKPAAPPPEWDIEAALDSIARVKRMQPSTICFTHFGPGQEAMLDQAATDIRRWDEILRPMAERGQTEEEMVDAVDRLTGRAPGSPGFTEAAEQLSSNRNSVLGYLRYYRKHVFTED